MDKNAFISIIRDVSGVSRILPANTYIHTELEILGWNVKAREILPCKYYFP